MNENQKELLTLLRHYTGQAESHVMRYLMKEGKLPEFTNPWDRNQARSLGLIEGRHFV